MMMCDFCFFGVLISEMLKSLHCSIQICFGLLPFFVFFVDIYGYSNFSNSANHKHFIILLITYFKLFSSCFFYNFWNYHLVFKCTSFSLILNYHHYSFEKHCVKCNNNLSHWVTAKAVCQTGSLMHESLAQAMIPACSITIMPTNSVSQILLVFIYSNSLNKYRVCTSVSFQDNNR